MTHERLRLPVGVVRERHASRRCWPITPRIGTFAGPKIAGLGLCHHASRHGRACRAPAAGASSRAAWARSPRRSPRRAREGHGDPDRRRGRRGAASRDGRATGVRHRRRARVPRAGVVASNVNAKTLYLDMVAPSTCRRSWCATSTRYRTFSTAFKMNIACERAAAIPRLRHAARSAASAIRPTCISRPDIDYLERAYDDAKYGWYSRAAVHHAGGADHRRRHPGPARQARRQPVRRPCALQAAERDCWADEARQLRASAVLDVIDELRAGLLATSIIDMQVLMPPDIERDRRLAAGPYLPRRAVGRSAVLPAAGCRTTPITARRCAGCTSLRLARPIPAAGSPAFPATTRRARS